MAAMQLDHLSYAAEPDGLAKTTERLSERLGETFEDGIGLVPFWFFWPLFVVVWIAVWLFVNGPMRVFNIRWRFFGGRLV